MFDELNTEINKSGGSYVKLNRKDHGVLSGTVLDAEVRDKSFEGAPVVSRKTGNVRKEWLFTLETDEGVVKFAANESAQFEVRSAVKASGGKLEKGGKLQISVKDDPATPTQQAEYTAYYQAPSATAVSAAIADDVAPF